MSIRRGNRLGHAFGGGWTELKLDAVSYYSHFYTRVLQDKPSKDRPFRLWYVDAFAGSGSRQEVRLIGGLFEGVPRSEEIMDFDGSARRALAVDPPYEHLVFIEKNRARFKCLEKIKAENAHRSIELLPGDANTRLCELFRQPPWSDQLGGTGSHRACVFLDPYGMAVDWETLAVLAATGAADIWYLFPLLAVCRQLANDISKVNSSKQRRLDAVLGTPTWRDDLYSTDPGNDMFPETIKTATRDVTMSQIETYASNRLHSLFRYVSPPLPMLNDRQAQLFSLYCLSNTSSDKAIGLIQNGVRSVLKEFGPEASRRKSVR